MKKVLLKFLVLLFAFSLTSFVVFAADEGTDIHKTVLPDVSKEVGSTSRCQIVMYDVNFEMDDARKAISTREDYELSKATANKLAEDGESVKFIPYTDILACGIMTGDIKMWMIPYYIRYILEFIIGVAGLVAVGALVYGGYLYLFAGISDDKEKGKNAIKNGLIGLVLILTAWAIVNIVLSLVTG